MWEEKINIFLYLDNIHERNIRIDILISIFKFLTFF